MNLQQIVTDALERISNETCVEGANRVLDALMLPRSMELDELRSCVYAPRRDVTEQVEEAIVRKSDETVGEHPGLLVDWAFIAAYEIPDLPGYTRYVFAGPLDQRHHQLIGLFSHAIVLVNETAQSPGDDDA